jgi:predicted porin
MKSTNRSVNNALARFSLILGALSATNVALAQTSNVQVYGVIDTYVGATRRSDQSAATGVVNGGGLTTSFWGVRGSEDLGGSYKAVFQLDSFFMPDTGTVGRTPADPFFGKNAFVGLAGPFRQVTLGRQVLNEPMTNSDDATG